MSLANLRPHDVRFTQDSIRGRFTNNTYLTSTFHALLSRKITPFDITPIEVTRRDGGWWAVTGNRRLYLYRKLEELGVIENIPVICKSINDNHVQRQLKQRMTTVSKGETIECRQPQAQAIIHSMIEKWKKQQSDRSMTSLCDSLSSTLTLNARQTMNYNNTSSPRENYGMIRNRNLLEDRETARATSVKRSGLALGEFSKGVNEQLTTGTYSATPGFRESSVGYAYTPAGNIYTTSGESLNGYSLDDNSEGSAYSQTLNSRNKSSGYKPATRPQLNSIPTFRESWNRYDLQSTTNFYTEEPGLRKQPTYLTNYRPTAKPITYDSSFYTHAYSTETGGTQRSSTNNSNNRKSWDAYYNPKERYNKTSRYEEHSDGYESENGYSVKSTSYGDCYKKDYEDYDDYDDYDDYEDVFELTQYKPTSRQLYPKPRISELHPNALNDSGYNSDSFSSSSFDYI